MHICTVLIWGPLRDTPLHGFYCFKQWKPYKWLSLYINCHLKIRFWQFSLYPLNFVNKNCGRPLILQKLCHGKILLHPLTKREDPGSIPGRAKSHFIAFFNWKILELVWFPGRHEIDSWGGFFETFNAIWFSMNNFIQIKQFRLSYSRCIASNKNNQRKF